MSNSPTTSGPAPARPLKVAASTLPGKAAPLQPRPSAAGAGNARAPQPTDISSPHELTAFVESLLTQLETRFDEMSTQVLERMNAMSTRVDSLEVSIQDLISGGLTPLLPQATGASTMGSDGVNGKES
ncbi:hypothetical protein DACRYDRAFT_104503 [Dacryopinax primogenitus]|uniref:Heat shock factor binding protein 1-domain-containing protein n=1 Tax=Dacryopinax primogenitus (strain DJM 731) TaxID=1858805 RepID=M5G7A6_DACPD|nr:uncharacterized protein DACRYDRAFT_104503 [Dacryopinax primogenitus]EJU04619.1 hypothetical protein DACRYDRAFT_104503 [Dacryopinax primogenitus]